jgi:hypothetical protein
VLAPKLQAQGQSEQTFMIKHMIARSLMQAGLVLVLFGIAQAVPAGPTARAARRAFQTRPTIPPERPTVSVPPKPTSVPPDHSNEPSEPITATAQLAPTEDLSPTEQPAPHADLSGTAPLSPTAALPAVPALPKTGTSSGGWLWLLAIAGMALLLVGALLAWGTGQQQAESTD